MANLKASKTSINVGVDVGKTFLHVYLYEKSIFFEVPNNGEGIAKLLKRLTYYHVVRIVMEATGRYEFDLAEACYLKKLPVVIARPISI